MDFKDSFSVSAIGMSIERARVEVAAMNLANANTVIKADGTGYRPMRVVANYAQPTQLFATLISEDANKVDSYQQSFSIEPIPSSPRQVFEPSHPMANEKGFVAYPSVDTATETVTMMAAMRAYEANVAAMNMSRNMALKALEIGGGN